MTGNVKATEAIAKGKGKANRSKQKKSKKTLVTLLLDRSASMESVREQTIVAINEWLNGFRKSKADIRVSLVLFDSYDGNMCLEKVFVARRIAEVESLTAADYVPRGGTPLIDAAWDTINAVRESIVGRDIRSVIAIQTDGQELHSTKHNWAQLRNLVSQAEEEGIQFQFMGAGIDAYEQGGQLGLSRDKIISYGMDRKSTRAAFEASAANTVSFAAGLSASAGYSVAQKLEAGDIYAGGNARGGGAKIPDFPGVFPGGVPRAGNPPSGGYGIDLSHWGGHPAPNFTADDFPVAAPARAVPRSPVVRSWEIRDGGK